MDTIEQKRIDATNHERQALAASNGWGFSPDAPELLERWPFKPFTEIGDKRLAFGVVSGTYGGVSFTAFDYHRRPKVTHVQGRYTGKVTHSNDTIHIDTLWVLTMPGKLPWFQIFDRSEPVYDLLEAAKPQTADAKVNRFYRLVDTDPQVAVQLLTPQVTAWMKEHKLYNWATYGAELVCVKHPIFGRVKPDELTARVAALGQLMAMLPPHQQPYPAQPTYHPQYPPPPQYPPQYPPPPPYPPQYPPPPGYPQQPYGHPGYPPPGYR